MEIPVDTELEAKQSELDALVRDWKTMYDLRLSDTESQIEFEEQDALIEWLDNNFHSEKFSMKAVVVSDTLNEGGENEDVTNLPENYRSVDAGGVVTIVLDGMEKLDKTEEKFKHVLLQILPARPLVQVSYKKNAVRLNLLPNEIEKFRLVRKDNADMIKLHVPIVKEEAPYKRREDGQDVGYKIHSLPSLIKAWDEAELLGEHLFVKLKDERMVIVEKSDIHHPVTPTVSFFYEDERGKHVDGKMIAWDFFNLEPVVYDPLAGVVKRPDLRRV